MERKSIDLLSELTLLDGVPGFEDEVRDYVREKLQGCGEFDMDNLGSLLCTHTGDATGPRLMLPAHLDEIGFLVKDVTDEGYIKFAPVGGWLDQTLLAHRVTVRTSKGKLTGVVGCTPPHMMPKEEREKLIKRRKMFIDVGARDKEHATEELGVRIGDPIIPRAGFDEVGDGKHFIAKAFDNRIGVALMIELMQWLKDREHPNVVIGAATVQEEVGTRGAKTAADVCNPDFCMVLDVGLATDMPGAEKETKVEMGGGPILYVSDAGTISHHKFHRFVSDIAEQEGIPYQLSLIEGGATDARVIQLHHRGVPSLPMGVPARYIHSHSSMVHADDYDQTMALLQAVIEAFDADAAEKLALR
jgi:endoglucanase